MIQQFSSTSTFQIKVFRVIFGIYLIWHFTALFPYAKELFSNEGVLFAEGLNPFKDKKAWPNPLFIWGSPLVVQIMIAFGIVASIALTLGKKVMACALYLWFLHSCLFTANPFTANPSLGYVGLILLLIAIIPRNSNYVPRYVIVVAWVLMSVGYTFSGLHKLSSPSWIDGTAIQYLMTNPLARVGIVRDVMLMLPDVIFKLMTWGTLALEVLFVPLALSRYTRPWAWLAMLLMHLGIMLTVDFADLSMGMVMIHLFTFSYAWVAPRKSRTKNTGLLFLDGDCLFCQKSVKSLYELDRLKNLHFSTLQGEAAEALPASWRTTEDCRGEASGEMVLIENFQQSNEKRWRGASAILRTFYIIGGIWSLLWWLNMVPSFIKDSVYQVIGKNRHRFNGGKKTCELPTKEFSERFIP